MSLDGSKLRERGFSVKGIAKFVVPWYFESGKRPQQWNGGCSVGNDKGEVRPKQLRFAMDSQTTRTDLAKLSTIGEVLFG